jgi:hypothetical protein
MDEKVFYVMEDNDFEVVWKFKTMV